jgi:hypothetical protein
VRESTEIIYSCRLSPVRMQRLFAYRYKDYLLIGTEFSLINRDECRTNIYKNPYIWTCKESEYRKELKDVRVYIITKYPLSVY